MRLTGTRTVRAVDGAYFSKRVAMCNLLGVLIPIIALVGGE